MRYIRVQVSAAMLGEQGSSVHFVVDTDASPPTAIARVESASADTVVEALNAE